MTHLSDEQFEEALKNPDLHSGHLSECYACRQRLEGMQALRTRLQSAFCSMKASVALADRIRTVTDKCTGHSAPLILKLRRYALPLTAAAAVLVFAVFLAIFHGGPASAQAAQQELVNIHYRNLAEEHDFYSEDEPEKLAQYFKDKLGFIPAMPKLNQGMAIRGCCIAHFREKIVGSYVVDTPHGVVSIIVVTDPPVSIGLKQFSRNGQTVWEGNLGMCNMAAVRMGNYTYTAVGEVSQNQLTQLLNLLVR